MDVLPVMKSLHKYDLAVFRHYNEEKYKPSQGDASRAIIQNKMARKALEKSTKKEESGLKNSSNNDATHKKACLCSPTTHLGSFRCRLHRAKLVKWPSNSLKNIAHSHQNQDAKDIEFSSFDISPKNDRAVHAKIISRFGRTACDKVPLTMASSKSEQVK